MFADRSHIAGLPAGSSVGAEVVLKIIRLCFSSGLPTEHELSLQ